MFRPQQQTPGLLNLNKLSRQSPKSSLLPCISVFSKYKTTNPAILNRQRNESELWRTEELCQETFQWHFLVRSEHLGSRFYGHTVEYVFEQVSRWWWSASLSPAKKSINSSTRPTDVQSLYIAIFLPNDIQSRAIPKERKSEPGMDELPATTHDSNICLNFVY